LPNRIARVKNGRPGRETFTAFLVLVLIGGGNAVAVRFTVLELDPFWAAASRFLCASIVFFALMLARRIPMPAGRDLFGDVLYGLLFFGVGFGFFYWGVQEAGAGTAQVILACIPLLTLVLAFAHGLEALTSRGIVGAVLAVMGFAFVFRDQLGASVPLASLLALFGGAAAIAEAGVVVKWCPRTHAISKNALGMAAGGALLLVLSLVAREQQLLPEREATWVGIAYLVLPGSVVVFTLLLFVLNRWTASAASYQFVLFPFATVALGGWLLDERVTPSFAIGAALALVGVYIGAIWESRSRPEAEPSFTTGVHPEA
jgi:drug/metabolite transporter (DMT)-like permease